MAALALGAAACFYDPDKPCGKNQVFDEAQLFCVCVDGSVLKDRVCVPCGANERVEGGACVCNLGFQKNAAGVCEASASLLGQMCTPGSTCNDATHSFCAPGPGGTGYCTQGTCAANGDCPAGYTCATWEAKPHCKRPPTGVGKSCGTDADCAGNDADFCEPLQSRSCLVKNCTVSPNTCTGGQVCCDVTRFGLPTLCVPPGSCPN